MSLPRKATEALIQWKQDATHRALLVCGARQVGKTFLIRDFAHDQYEHLVEVNLLEQPEARDSFAAARDADNLFLRITTFASDDVVAHKTLIFIDEVQEAPELMTMVKFLVDRYGDRYDFVFSGSLLGIELKQVRSAPVGYLRIIEMFPLDFEEFCWALSVPRAVIEEARAAFTEHRPVDDAVHARLLEAFHHYLIVGGMPDAVSAFAEERNIPRVRDIQHDILDLYRYDISKYAGKRARTVRRIFDLIPSELNTQSKRFAFAHIEEGGRFDRYDNDFMWLVDAGVALPTCNVSEPRYPLELSVDSAYFKLFLCDVGLLTCASSMDVVRDVLNDRADVNYGSLYENYVAQEFAAHGLCSPAPDMHLYFFRSRRIGEVDFVAEYPQGRVLPVEVKSGKSYKRHSALDSVLKTDNYGIEHAVVLNEGNVELEGQITYLPMYMTMFLQLD